MKKSEKKREKYTVGKSPTGQEKVRFRASSFHLEQEEEKLQKEQKSAFHGKSFGAKLRKKLMKTNGEIDTKFSFQPQIYSRNIRMQPLEMDTEATPKLTTESDEIARVFESYTPLLTEEKTTEQRTAASQKLQQKKQMKMKN
ncbi:MAG: hypothetical protein LIO74_04095 [Ruminococcus sp.]|nr:hypothetical protein [Ruminococcus sp.]